MKSLLNAFLPLVALVTCSVAQAAVYTVGTPVGPGQCTHATIQSAVDAAHANPGSDTIRISRTITGIQVPVAISTNQNLDIEGGYATCTQAQPDGLYTRLDGENVRGLLSANLDSSAVLRLRGLQLTRSYGPGLLMAGGGRLEVRHSSLDNNRRSGILVSSTTPGAELVVGEGALVLNNIYFQTFGVGGGGIHLGGPVELIMTEPDTLVAYNEGFAAGGIYVGSQAVAYIGSPGYAGLPVIYGNHARGEGNFSYGGAGGIQVVGELKLFTTDPAHPVRIGDNSSPGVGGVQVHGENARLCAWDFVIDGNVGGEAGALRATDGTVILNRSNASGCIYPPVARACAPYVHCNSISGNLTQEQGGAATEGATVLLADAVLSGRRVRMMDNHGGHLVHGNNSGVSLDNCLLARNSLTRRLIDTGPGGADAFLYLSDCTIADNANALPALAHTASPTYVFNSIIHQPGRQLLEYDGNGAPAPSFSYLLLHDLQAVPFHHTLRAGEPRFVAPAAGDYHLRSDSPALDFAPGIVSVAHDLDGDPRDVSLVGQAPIYGPRDLGAYERQPEVMNGSFDSDLRHWTVLAGEWDGSQNVTGSVSSGSWKYSGTGLMQTRVELGRQCRRLSEPGRYDLYGWGKGGGSTVINRDYAVVAWEFRRDGGASCTSGQADRSGELTLGYGTTWRSPADPMPIEVPLQEWTPHSSITLTLVAVDGGVSQPASISAWFDGVELSLGESEHLFGHGFEE